jgi:MFS family permease
MLAYADVGLLTPTIPLYIASLGHSELVVGLVLAAFSVPSFLLRPLIGYLADRWNVRAVLSLGMLLLAGSGLALTLPALAVLFPANALRGTAWASINTAGNVVLAATAPPSRRGEASSYYNLFQSATSVLAPAVALWLLGSPASRFDTVILVAAASSLIGAAFSRAISSHDVGRARENRAASISAPGGVSRFLDRRVWFPTVLLAAIMVAHPPTRGFVPLFAERVGIPGEQVVWYYLAAGAAALAGRAALGRLSDRFGRRPMLIVGFSISASGLAMFSVADGIAALIAAGVMQAMGDAIVIPCVYAMAIELGDPARRGTAMATFSLAFQVGQGIGAALAGGVIVLAGYRSMYLTIAGISLLGLALSFFKGRSGVYGRSSTA